MSGYKSIKPRWKKGESGNPNGRPKLPDLKEAMSTILGETKEGRTALEAILSAIRLKAVKGDIRAAELLLKYTYQLPSQRIETDEGVRSINVVFKRDEATQ